MFESTRTLTSLVFDRRQAALCEDQRYLHAWRRHDPMLGATHRAGWQHAACAPGLQPDPCGKNRAVHPTAWASAFTPRSTPHRACAPPGAVCYVQGKQAPRLVLLAGLPGDNDTPFGVVVTVAVVVGDADEVEHRERGFVARLARAAPTHLLVQDRRACEPREDEAHDLGAIEASVEHVH